MASQREPRKEIAMEGNGTENLKSDTCGGFQVNIFG
jgi:hypothetical protein